MAEPVRGKSEPDSSQLVNPFVEFLDIRIADIPMAETVEFILSAVSNRTKVVVSYVNIHTLNLAYETPWFRAFLNRSDLVFCDGFGVWLGARLSGQALHHRYTPPDWLPILARRCVEQGASIYLLGARPGVAEQAGAALQAQAPGLRIAGAADGYFDKTPDCPENRAVVAKINASQADILLVGFGMPAQEKWIQDNLEDLNVHAILPVGAAFDYLAGNVARAPRWMTDHGLEWLGRLVIEPRRLWKRYLVGNPKFFWRVFDHRLNAQKLNHSER